jgi:hypothetical protein
MGHCKASYISAPLSLLHLCTCSRARCSRCLTHTSPPAFGSLSRNPRCMESIPTSPEQTSHTGGRCSSVSGLLAGLPCSWTWLHTPRMPSQNAGNGELIAMQRRMHNATIKLATPMKMWTAQKFTRSSDGLPWQKLALSQQTKVLDSLRNASIRFVANV